MKVYRVPVYRVIYDHYPKYGALSVVDTILVKRKVFGISEVLTGFDGIDIINRGYLKNGVLDYYSRKPVKAEVTGYHLVVFAEDLVQKNLVRPEDLDPYIDQYDSSGWKKVYDDMKILTKKEKKELKQKMYSVYSSKK